MRPALPREKAVTALLELVDPVLTEDPPSWSAVSRAAAHFPVA